ncbi:hypothetical protein PCANC_26371 [Puccinia coronata f. sp. avenae]|uniref:Uncharacterized protein n=1 Tax=Puccinia coronata f. sp. avenae TaxID=200324 RepID=A0A2N5S4V6_9BASI|nr:hypothetical protein PCANC_26371 [Puccinia coronata f. sp. avenae]
MQLVGKIWRDLSNEEQLKYNDWDYINELRLQMGLEKLDNPEGLEPEDKTKPLDANANSSRGSVYGNEYMALLTGSPTGDPWKAFRLWASGLTADQAWRSNGITRSTNKSGATPRAELPPWDLGDLKKNKSSMLDQLRKMLVKATRGKRCRGWPEHAEKDFKELGLVLKVAKEAAPMRVEELLLKQATKTFHKDEVKYVLEALHNNWVLLVCKDAEDVVVEGAEEVV